jgi:selenocysteine-specific elongation factor
MHILGTAGHVDHGKSSLVRALTGTDPDRWIEEKLRGMTLDLGFAHLRFPDGVEAGIVDVPGHERFLHNMLAGAAGMELLLLVVAANEGPRPQTIEHLAILSYLNVRRAIVVLTKSDLVGQDELEIARALTAQATRGTVAEGAPVFAVSTVSGNGLDALRDAIHDALCALAPREPNAPAYLPIDRVFALAGHGTIVTGTLMQGSIATGETLQLSPLGRGVRVRSLQVFGERKDRVEGGARVAANLPGVETGDIERGAVLASPQFAPQASFDVSFRPLASALHMLRRRTPVRVHLGSSEILGTLVFEVVPSHAETVDARLRLRAPAIGFPGAAYIVRRMSPKDVLGGGTLAHARANDIATASGDDDLATGVLAALRAAGIAGATAAGVGAAANVREELADETLSRLHDDGRVHRLSKPPAYVDAHLIEALFERVREALERGHSESPWMMGMTSLGLARATGVPEQSLVRALALLSEDGRIVHRAGYFAMPDFAPQLAPEQREFFERSLAVDSEQPFVPASLTEIVARMKTSRVAGISQAFDTLVASGAVVKVGDAVYRAAQIAEARRKLEEALRRDREITMARFRDIVGTSRKYAVPLLEWFDATGVTVRAGDVRVLRETRSTPPAGAES